MVNPIKEIVKFNQQAGLVEKGYDDFLESSFQIEEALEGFIETAGLSDYLKCPTSSAEDLSRGILKHVGATSDCISDVDRLDKACDAVVYAVGSMAKLGLNAQEITKALNIVMQKNFEKLNCPKDEFGKLMKPEGFVGPEKELQKILDNIKK